MIRGLVINGFSQDGMRFTGDAVGNQVQGCYVGTDPAGVAAVPNGGNGINLFIGAVNTHIGGLEARTRNVISGNGSFGIVMALASRNQVQGNYIGTDVRGEAALPNEEDGVSLMETTEILVGGTVSSARNVISGNLESGVTLAREASNNRVQGNYIGLNAVGTSVLPNQGSGVEMTEGSENLIGGTTRSARNVISGNALHGARVGSGAVANRFRATSSVLTP